MMQLEKIMFEKRFIGLINRIDQRISIRNRGIGREEEL